MMTSDQRELAERAEAAGFAIVPGCRVLLASRMVAARALLGRYGRVVGDAGDGLVHVVWDDMRMSTALASHMIPDFTDAATLGCLMEAVRKKWGPTAFIEFESRKVHNVRSWPQPWPEDWRGGQTHGAWGLCRAFTENECSYDPEPPPETVEFGTEVEALVAALESKERR